MRRRFVAIGVAVLVPLLWGVASLGASVAAFLDHPVLEVDPAEFPPQPEPTGLPVVALLASNSATELTDLIAPLAVLGATGALDVVTVAPERRVSALTGGAAFVPHHSFASFEQHYGHAAWVVVPAVMDPDDPGLVAWLAMQAENGAGVLSICEGARLAGRAGVLDGRRATSHFFALDGLAEAFPDVAWERGSRVVVDGNRVSSAGVTAAIDASLATAEMLTGAAGAQRARDRLGLRAVGPTDEPAGFAGTGWGWGLLAAGFRGGAQQMGVLLEPGTDELTLAAWLDALPRSLRVKTWTLSQGDRLVRGRHGLDMVPTLKVGRAKQLDVWARLETVVDGAESSGPMFDAEARGAGPQILVLPTAEPLDRTPFDTALTWLARVHGLASARVSAATLEYPRAELDARWATLGADSRWVRDLLVPFGLAAGGGGVAVGIGRMRSRRSQASQPERL